MPGPGFESITITEAIHKKLKKKYEDNKEGLAGLGILSFSRFVSVFLHEMIEPENFQVTINRLIKRNTEKMRQIS